MQEAGALSGGLTLRNQRIPRRIFNSHFGIVMEMNRELGLSGKVHIDLSAIEPNNEIGKA